MVHFQVHGFKGRGLGDLTPEVWCVNSVSVLLSYNFLKEGTPFDLFFSIFISPQCLK